jgi:hypothetical protein
MEHLEFLPHFLLIWYCFIQLGVDGENSKGQPKKRQVQHQHPLNAVVKKLIRKDQTVGKMTYDL